MLKKIFTWILTSSNDPSKMSLTVKAAIVLAIPTVLSWVDLTCRFAAFCVPVDASGLQLFATAAGNIVLGFLTLVAGVAAAYGFIRKIFLTITGKNRALEG